MVILASISMKCLFISLTYFSFGFSSSKLILRHSLCIHDIFVLCVVNIFFHFVTFICVFICGFFHYINFKIQMYQNLSTISYISSERGTFLHEVNRWNNIWNTIINNKYKKVISKLLSFIILYWKISLHGFILNWIFS